MATLDILHFPDSRLRTRAKLVEEVNDGIRRIVNDMFETMYAAPGIGLAATQVNIHQRTIVMDISMDHNQPLCLINPELLESEGEEVTEEGCLSVPGFFEKVARAEQIRVRFMNEKGELVELEAEGLLAVCIQHEMDHLEGKLFVDYLSPLKRTRIRHKLEKQAHRGEFPESRKTPVI